MSRATPNVVVFDYGKLGGGNRPRGIAAETL
jgi:hypothetical protein